MFNDDGQVVDFRTFMVPREKYQIVDVWNVVGLRGTGSNDIVVEEIFIPEAFTLSMGETGQCKGPGQEQSTPPTSTSCRSTRSSPTTITHADHRHGARAPTPSTSTCSRSGCARRTSARRRRSTRSPRSGSPGRPREIDAAWALLMNNIREEQALVAKGEKIPLGLRLKVRRDQVLGTQRAIDAIDALFEASGGRALAEGTYLQRAWRDAHAGRVHAANDPERALQMYGAHEFGHKVDPGMY